MKQARTLAITLAAVVLLFGAVAPGTAAQEPAAGDATMERAKEHYDRYFYEEAYRQFLLLAEAGDPEAPFYLGWMHIKGQAAPQDDAQAVHWYRRAAELGYAGAQYNLAWMYENGRGVAQDSAQAEYWYRRAAEQGLVHAAVNLDGKYGEDGEAGDDAEAVRWYLRVARACRLVLGNQQMLMYMDHSFIQHAKQAIAAIHKLAEKGDAFAQFGFATINDKPQCGQIHDWAEALKWYRAAAAQDHAGAQAALGTYYYFGQSVPQDYSEAVSWFRKAAVQGHAQAQTFLAMTYFNGQGMPRDHAEAAGWFTKAAEQGFALAQASLGMMYLEGKAVQRNNVTAYMLFGLALEQLSRTPEQKAGDDLIIQKKLRDHYAEISQGILDALAAEVRKNRDALAAIMALSEIAEAELLAGEWRARIAAAEGEAQ